MKLTTRITALVLALFCLPALAQFRNTNGVYQYQTTLQAADVWLIGRPSANTNYNFASSNALNKLAAVAAGGATFDLNGTATYAGVATNAGILTQYGSIYLGSNNVPQTGFTGILIGNDHNADGYAAGYGIKIGRSAGGVADKGIAIGNGALANTSTVGIGDESDASGIRSVLVGAQSYANGNSNVIVGAFTDSDHNDDYISVGVWNPTGTAPHWMYLGSPTTTNTLITGKVNANGGGVTNLTYNFVTNGNNTGTIAVGQVMYTNITGNITLGLFSGTIDKTFRQWATCVVSNAAALGGANYTVTLPASVVASTNAFVLGTTSSVIYVTNGSWVEINFNLHPYITNAAVNRYSR